MLGNGAVAQFAVAQFPTGSLVALFGKLKLGVQIRPVLVGAVDLLARANLRMFVRLYQDPVGPELSVVFAKLINGSVGRQPVVGDTLPSNFTTNI